MKSVADNSARIAETLATALALVRAGFAVIPVAPGSKVPTEKNWTKLPFPTEEEVRGWFSNRVMNIGVRTGKISRFLIVVDLDPKNGGLVSEEALIDRYGDWPDTIVVRTQSGGYHRWYRADGADIRNSAGLLAEGIDIRAEGGFVVCPPSMIADREYLWHDYPDGTPDFAQVAPLPVWVSETLARARKPAPVDVRGAIDPSLPRLITAGRRRTSLLSVVGALRNQALGDEVIAAVISHVNANRCFPPLDDAELRTLVSTTGGWEQIPQWETAWQDDIRTTKAGDWEGTMSTVAIILRHDPRFSGMLRYNLLTERVEATRAPPFHANTHVDEYWITQFRSFLTAPRLLGHKMREPSGASVHEALYATAKINEYHPIRDYLNALVWDGTERVRTFFSDFCGCEQNEYTAWLGIVLFVGSISRVISPGGTHRQVIVLQGPENIGKTRLIYALTCGRWSGGLSLSMDSKDAIINLAGLWLVELSELASLRRTDIERVKDFISRPIDKYRPPYGRVDVTIQRQCVFIGTTNQDAPLPGDEGNTRFLPVRVEGISLDALAPAVVDQLWAEGMRLYADGAEWWSPSPEAAELSADARDAATKRDAWEPQVAAWCEGEAAVGFTIADVWERGLGGGLSKLTVADQMRISTILKQLGYVKRRASVGGSRAIRWHKLESRLD